MIEKLVPLDLPPGLKNNGTVLQSKDRWFAGNLVRFYQGNIQPVGGWVKRTLTGATITGTPNAAHSWSLNDGTSWLAVGTTTNLYIVDSANVVYDITPISGFSPTSDVTWQLDNFGQSLVAVPNGDTNPSWSVNCFVWGTDGPTSPALQVEMDVLIAPYHFFGVVVTPERYMFLLRGTDAATLGGGGMLTFRAAQGGAVADEVVN